MEGGKVKIISVYVQENSLIASIAARNLRSTTCALVIRNTVYLHGMTRHEFIQNPSLLRHEVEHIRQWQREGFWSFLAKYLWYSLRVGYYNNPFEVEARDSESDIDFLQHIRIH
jgi:hypothetical protein